MSEEDTRDVATAIFVLAHYLGINLDTEKDLLYIADEAFDNLPPGWDWDLGEGEHAGIPFFYNKETGESEWHHPNEAFYFNKVKSEQKRKNDKKEKKNKREEDLEVMEVEDWDNGSNNKNISNNNERDDQNRSSNIKNRGIDKVNDNFQKNSTQTGKSKTFGMNEDDFFDNDGRSDEAISKEHVKDNMIKNNSNNYHDDGKGRKKSNHFNQNEGNQAHDDQNVKFHDEDDAQDEHKQISHSKSGTVNIDNLNQTQRGGRERTGSNSMRSRQNRGIDEHEDEDELSKKGNDERYGNREGNYRNRRGNATDMDEENPKFRPVRRNSENHNEDPRDRSSNSNRRQDEYSHDMDDKSYRNRNNNRNNVVMQEQLENQQRQFDEQLIYQQKQLQDQYSSKLSADYLRYESEISKLNAEKVSLEDRIISANKRSQDEIFLLKDDIKRLEDRCLEEKNQRKALEEKLTVMQSDSFIKLREVEDESESRLRDAIRKTKQECEEDTRERVKIAERRSLEEIEELKNELQIAKRKIEQSISEAEAMRRKVNISKTDGRMEVQTELDALKLNVVELEDRNNQLQNELRKLRDDYNQATTKLNVAIQASQMSAIEADTAKVAANRAISDSQTDRAALLQATHRLQQLDMDCAKLNAENIILKRDKESMSIELRKLQGIASITGDRFSSAESEARRSRTQAQSEISRLTSKIAEQDAMISALRDQLDHASMTEKVLERETTRDVDQLKYELSRHKERLMEKDVKESELHYRIQTLERESIQIQDVVFRKDKIIQEEGHQRELFESRFNESQRLHAVEVNHLKLEIEEEKKKYLDMELVFKQQLEELNREMNKKNQSQIVSIMEEMESQWTQKMAKDRQDMKKMHENQLERLKLDYSELQNIQAEKEARDRYVHVDERVELERLRQLNKILRLQLVEYELILEKMKKESRYHNNSRVHVHMEDRSSPEAMYYPPYGMTASHLEMIPPQTINRTDVADPKPVPIIDAMDSMKHTNPMPSFNIRSSESENFMSQPNYPERSNQKSLNQIHEPFGALFGNTHPPSHQSGFNHGSHHLSQESNNRSMKTQPMRDMRHSEYIPSMDETFDPPPQAMQLIQHHHQDRVHPSTSQSFQSNRKQLIEETLFNQQAFMVIYQQLNTMKSQLHATLQDNHPTYNTELPYLPTISRSEYSKQSSLQHGILHPHVNSNYAENKISNATQRTEYSQPVMNNFKDHPIIGRSEEHHVQFSPKVAFDSPERKVSNIEWKSYDPQNNSQQSIPYQLNEVYQTPLDTTKYANNRSMVGIGFDYQISRPGDDSGLMNTSPIPFVESQTKSRPYDSFDSSALFSENRNSFTGRMNGNFIALLEKNMKQKYGEYSKRPIPTVSSSWSNNNNQFPLMDSSVIDLQQSWETLSDGGYHSGYWKRKYSKPSK